MRSRRNLRRKAISVMFMTFIAISILTTVFLTMYLYLLRASTMASEAERLYAEAAQERLEVVLDESKGLLNVTNTGGIGITIKYMVEVDKNSGKAIFTDWGVSLSPGESVSKSYSQPEGVETLILTERGNLFKANLPPAPQPVTFPVTLELDPVSIEIGRGQKKQVTLRVKAGQNYPGGRIYLAADSSDCLMDFFLGSYRFIDDVSLDPNYVNVNPGETKEVSVTISAKSLFLESGSVCHIWFMAMNSSGGVWVEAGLKVTTE